MSGNKHEDGGKEACSCCRSLGRFCCDCLKRIIFYLIFYSCLLGIFIGSIQVMLLTISDYIPKYQDRILQPGLTHVPSGGEIVFELKDHYTWRQYVRRMREFLRDYEDTRQIEDRIFEDCGSTPNPYMQRGELERMEDFGMRKVCRFSREWLHACSGENDPDFGFSTGQPCLIVKLNRIINFMPQPLDISSSFSADLPDAVQAKLQPNVIPIHCTSKRAEDEAKVGEILYHGIGGGFPLQYYPYYGRLLHPYYLQPLVAIQFVNVTMNEQVWIECRVFGKNIAWSAKDRYLGRFDFKLTIFS